MPNYNRVRCTTGNFDWMHPNENQVQVLFFWRKDAPDKVKAKKSIVAWDVGDGEDYFEFATEAIDKIYKWSERVYGIDKEWIKAAKEYLHSTEDEDYKEELLVKKLRLEDKLSIINSQLKSLEAQGE